jgi:hypothetical protein
MVIVPHVADAFNGHLYDYISAPLSFPDAIIAAAAFSPIKGMPAHMAVITSPEEHVFVLGMLISTPGWIGLTDEAQEGVYEVVAGPETGAPLLFTVWNTLEPSSEDGEDCVEVRGVGWSDVQCSTATGYYVEYECPEPGSASPSGCTRMPSYQWHYRFDIQIYMAIFSSHVCILVVPSLHGHYYAVLSGVEDMQSALLKASTQQYRGMQGHLATVDSLSEFAFLRWAMHIGSVWVAAIDTAGNGTWTHGAGNRAGDKLWPTLWGLDGLGGAGRTCAVLGASGLRAVQCNSVEVISYLVEFECADRLISVRGVCVGKSTSMHARVSCMLVYRWCMLFIGYCSFVFSEIAFPGIHRSHM